LGKLIAGNAAGATRPAQKFAVGFAPWMVHAVSYKTFGMKIVTCIKPVPDPASKLIINETKTWVKDQDLTFVAREPTTMPLRRRSV
jgi:hypothetical protein